MYEALFLAKKCITSFLVPPGIFVLVLLVSGLLLLRSRTRKIGVFSCVIALLLWLSSMTSFSEKLLSTLESSMVIPENSKGDVIVVLGGWAYGDARDISGNGALDGDTCGAA